jgi:hypothetical protein
MKKELRTSIKWNTQDDSLEFIKFLNNTIHDNKSSKRSLKLTIMKIIKSHPDFKDWYNKFLSHQQTPVPTIGCGNTQDKCI